jgi:hypothetical protein
MAAFYVARGSISNFLLRQPITKRSAFAPISHYPFLAMERAERSTSTGTVRVNVNWKSTLTDKVLSRSGRKLGSKEAIEKPFIIT